MGYVFLSVFGSFGFWLSSWAEPSFSIILDLGFIYSKKKHDDLLKIIFQTLHYGQVSLKKNYVCVFNRKKQYIKEKDKNKNILHDFIFYIHYGLNNKFIKLMRNLL
jgi:hypothetical protein